MKEKLHIYIYIYLCMICTSVIAYYNSCKRCDCSTGMNDTYYSLTKQAQELFFIQSCPNLSTQTAPLKERFHRLTDQLVQLLEKENITSNHIIHAFPMLPTNVRCKYKSYLDNILYRFSKPLFTSSPDFIMNFNLLKWL